MNLEEELDKDNIFESLYHYLWMKSPLSELKDECINIPQTVLFQSGQPVAWFYSLKDGTIHKKNFVNTVFEKIEEAFLREISESGVVANYIHYNEAGEITVMYLDEKKFIQFIRGKTRPQRGVLQKFIEPKGDFNFTIQAIWSKNICLLSKRINRKNLLEKKYDIYEKACTFDGPDFFSDLIPIKGNYGAEIRSILEKISEHISLISYERFSLNRLLVYLKQDPSGKFWILWSNSARLEKKKKIVMKKERPPLYSKFFEGVKLNNKPLALEHHIRIPQNIKTVMSTSKQKPLLMDHNLICINCQQLGIDKNFMEIPYKYFIDESEIFFKKKILDRLEREKNEELELDQEEIGLCPLSEERVGNMESILRKGDDRKIPEILRKLHPRLNNINYDKIKHSNDFIMKKVAVCELCYYHYSKYMQGSGDNIKEKLLPQVNILTPLNFRPNHSRTVSETHKKSLRILFEEVKLANLSNKACHCPIEAFPKEKPFKKSDSCCVLKTDKSLENLSTKLSSSFKIQSNRPENISYTPNYFAETQANKKISSSQKATATSEFSFFRRRSRSDHRDESLIVQDSVKGEEGKKVEILNCGLKYGLSSSHNIRNKIRAKLLEKFRSFATDVPKEHALDTVVTSSSALEKKIKINPRAIVQKSLSEARDTYCNAVTDKHPFLVRMADKIFKRKSLAKFRSSSCQRRSGANEESSGASSL